jgi:orotidine-5'-phosphate decarboxylase
MNDQVGLLINSSRGIIYASSSSDFAESAAKSALKIQVQMQKELSKL